MEWFACECRNRGPVAIQADKGPDCYDRSMGYEFVSVLHKPFATEQAAMAYFGEPVMFCKECGHRINLNYFEDERKRLIERELCFRCNHWHRLLGNPQSIVIDHGHYMLGPQKQPSNHNGFSGRWFHIRMLDGREIHTCDLWFQGHIPDRFQSRIPDNAEFMDGTRWVNVGGMWCIGQKAADR